MAKHSTKFTATQTKPVRRALPTGRPYVLVAVVAGLLLAGLLAVTWYNTHSASGKAAQGHTLPVRQTAQELAEEATQALRQGETDVFLDLLASKIKDPNIVNSYGDSLLLAAATLGNVEAVQQLLALGADVNKQNYNTRDTAVLRSVAADHDEITRLLVYERANLNLPNNYGQTPMGLAVEKQKGELVDLFLTNGVKAGLDGETLLRSSAQNNLVGVIGMLKGGVNPNSANAAGNTALIVAASVGDTQAVRALLAYRADVNRANQDGNTAILYAARNNHPETLQALLAPLTMQYRADVNAQNKRGETALYWAARLGYAPVVKILLAHGADKTLATQSGETARSVAKKYKRTDVLKLL